jgi:site-specific DNA-methyltransferase (adenine-specific)
MGDVWEIGVIAPVAKERTGYPSQKPEILLERLVRALSDEGDRVLDPYAGSGTSLAVAHRMGRCFLGVDSSPVALEVARARLDAIGAPVAEKCDRDGCGALPPTADHLTRNLAFRALPGNTR